MHTMTSWNLTPSGPPSPVFTGPNSRATSPDIVRHSQPPPRFPGGNNLSSRPSSLRASSSSFYLHSAPQKYFKSRRINKGEIQKPWVERKDPKKKWHTIFPVIGIILGLIFTGLLTYQGYSSVINNDYCPIYMEDFSSGHLDEKVWTKEVEVGGFGYVMANRSLYEPRLF